MKPIKPVGKIVTVPPERDFSREDIEKIEIKMLPDETLKDMGFTGAEIRMIKKGGLVSYDLLLRYFRGCPDNKLSKEEQKKVDELKKEDIEIPVFGRDKV